MHDAEDLIELWDRAEKVCQDTEKILEERRLRVERSAALLAAEPALVRQTERIIARSRTLLSKLANSSPPRRRPGPRSEG